MKKVFLIVLAAIALSSTAFAQKAIGLRFGGGSVTNFEVSYQQPMNANRLELDFGVATGNESLNLSVVGIYHWKFNIVNALDWYVGPGVAAGLYLSDIADRSGIALGIGGQIGLEYSFAGHGVPLMLSVDTRPMFRLVHPKAYGNFGWEACLSIRYLL